jgi:methyltransferase family protein
MFPMNTSLARRAREWLGFSSNDLHAWAAPLNDEEWFDAIDTAARSPEQGRADMPTVPDAGAQLRFTGRSGTENLRQAFAFYQYCLQYVSAHREIGWRDRILDFGCGWGRIARFWLREFKPSQIWCIDCLSDAIELIQATRLPVNILKNDPLPPVAGLPKRFRLIYAYSVFSHLSEAVALRWIDYFADRLAPGGHLIFTTMGLEYLAVLRGLRAAPPEDFHQRRTIELAPGQDELEARYAAGEFVFFGTGGGVETTDDFYGIAMIPEAWLSKLNRNGLEFRSARQDIAGINQTVAVMQKSA